MTDKYNFRRASRDKEYRKALYENFGAKARVGYAKYKASKAAESYGKGTGTAGSRARGYIQAKRAKRNAKFNAQFKKSKKGKGMKKTTVNSVYQSIKPKGKRRDPFLDFIRG